MVDFATIRQSDRRARSRRLVRHHDSFVVGEQRCDHRHQRVDCRNWDVTVQTATPIQLAYIRREGACDSEIRQPKCVGQSFDVAVCSDTHKRWPTMSQQARQKPRIASASHGQQQTPQRFGARNGPRDKRQPDVRCVGEGSHEWHWQTVAVGILAKALVVEATEQLDTVHREWRALELDLKWACDLEVAHPGDRRQQVKRCGYSGNRQVNR